MRPSLRQIEYFVAVAETQSFGAAAQSLAVTQPSLSKQIQALEADLGVVLFERTSRRVSLTPQGRALLPDAQRVLRQARRFRNKARSLGFDTDIRLVAGVLPSIGAYFMPRMIERLRQEMPGLKLSFVEGPSSELARQLVQGELDFVLASETDRTDLARRDLFTETLWLCSTPEDPVMQSDAPATLSDLKGRTLLTLSPEFHLNAIVARLAAQAGATLSTEYRGASLDAIRQIAANGPEVGVLPSLYALGEAIRDPHFKVRRLLGDDAEHPVVFYTRTSSPLQALNTRLADIIILEKQAIRAERAPQFQV
jgi:LysR family transcriptional regulator, hydrogen peroxide-inducible genes activator